MRVKILRFFKYSFYLLSAIAVLLIIFNIYLRLASKGVIYSQEACPTAEFALVFGTSPYVIGGDANPHYWGRINLAAKLYQQKKVQVLILSGDNQYKNYNEPKAMKKDLIKLGVDKQNIRIDPLGLNTIDTIKRSRVFYQPNARVIFITQDYHLPRAILIAKALQINAVGCKAKAPVGASFWFVYVREVLARIKTGIELMFI